MNRILWNIRNMEDADWEHNVRCYRSGNLGKLLPNLLDVVDIAYPGWIAADWFVKEMEL